MSENEEVVPDDLDAQLDQELEGVLTDEAPEAAEEAAQATTPEAAEGQAEEAAETPEVVAEGEAPEGTTEPEADAEQEAEDELADLKDAEGNFSAEAIAKAKKSWREAQKLIGKTAKDREEVNTLRQRAQYADVWDQVAREEPELQAAIQRVVARRRGESVPPEPRPEPAKPAVPKDELNAKVLALFKAGDIVAGQALLNEHDPDIQDAKRAREELKRFKEEQRAEAERQRVEERTQADLAAFKAKYAGSLFEKDGSVKDQELHGQLCEVLQGKRGYVTFEEALVLAEEKLGRKRVPVTPKPKVDPAKRQAMNMPKGTKPPAKPLTKPKRAEDLSVDELTAELEAAI